jgi:hypothetical protein
MSRPHGTDGIAARQEGDGADYNYANFRGEEDFAGFMGRLHAGERAPDAALTDLDAPSETVTLSSLWRERHLVLEFGSYT